MEMKIFYRLLKISLLSLISIFVFYSMSLGSGGSLISAGAIGGYDGNETGYRQLIKLHVNGKILSASPENGAIRMITLYAPGLSDGKLIIRELDLSGQGKTVLISASKKVRTKIKRATIYLEHSAKDVLLYQENENGWECLEPIKLIAPPQIKENGPNEIWAYSISDLGHFRLLSGADKFQADTVSNLNIGLFPMASINSGFFPWVCAGFVFIVIDIFSHIIHKMERRGTE